MPFHHLLTRTVSDATNFRKTLRAYNVVLSVASIGAYWVKKVPHSSNFNSITTVKGKLYHHIGERISPQQIKHSYDYVYVHDTDEVQRAAIKGSSVDRHLNLSIVIGFGALPSQNTATPRYFNAYMNERSCTIQMITTWSFRRIIVQQVSMLEETMH